MMGWTEVERSWTKFNHVEQLSLSRRCPPLPTLGIKGRELRNLLRSEIQRIQHPLLLKLFWIALSQGQVSPVVPKDTKNTKTDLKLWGFCKSAWRCSVKLWPWNFCSVMQDQKILKNIKGHTASDTSGTEAVFSLPYGSMIPSLTVLTAGRTIRSREKS